MTARKLVGCRNKAEQSGLSWQPGMLTQKAGAEVQSELFDVIEIRATFGAFAAIRRDGRVVAARRIRGHSRYRGASRPHRNR